MSIKVLGLDPGKTTGYALIECLEYKRTGCINPGETIRKIEPIKWGNIKDMTLVEIQPIINEADCICYEGWRTFDKHARTGRLSFQKVPAEQVIGALMTLLKLRTKSGLPAAQIHENLSGQKPVGYGYAGMKYVAGKKGMHWQDAMAHAVYFAVDKLNWPPVGVDA